MKNCLQINAPQKNSPNPSKGGECQKDDGKERKEKPPPTPPKEGRDKWGNDLKTKLANIQSVYPANLYLFGTPLLWRGWGRLSFIHSITAHY